MLSGKLKLLKVHTDFSTKLVRIILTKFHKVITKVLFHKRNMLIKLRRVQTRKCKGLSNLFLWSKLINLSKRTKTRDIPIEVY